MTYEEAIKVLRFVLDPREYPNGERSKCYQYNLEAINKAISSLKKQIPKKPVDNPENGWFECPNCGLIVWIYYGAGETHHCDCGQRLDWEGIE